MRNRFILGFAVAVSLSVLMGANDFRMPAGSVGNREVTSSAGSEIAPEKLQHVYNDACNFDLAIGATPTTQEKVLFVASKAGTINEVGAGLVDTGSSTNCTFDIKKNGTTMLTSAISVTHSDADRATVVGSLSVATYADGDVISVSCTATTTTGAQGPFVEVRRRETGT